MTEQLYAPYKLGTVELDNRFVMSPMTRNRATPTRRGHRR